MGKTILTLVVIMILKNYTIQKKQMKKVNHFTILSLAAALIQTKSHPRKLVNYASIRLKYGELVV